MRPDLAALRRTAEKASVLVLAKIAEPLVPAHKALYPIEYQITVLKDALAELRRLLPKPTRVRLRVRRPVRRVIQAVEVARPLDDLVLPKDPGQLSQEISGCKMLLLEIIRRAAYDWVLYRSSRKMTNLVMAEQAYTWIFQEGPQHPDWTERTLEGKTFTSFESICLHLELEPEMVRKYIRKLEPRNVMSIGRPAERRRGGGQESEMMAVSISSQMLDEAFTSHEMCGVDHS